MFSINLGATSIHVPASLVVYLAYADCLDIALAVLNCTAIPQKSCAFASIGWPPFVYLAVVFSIKVGGLSC